MPRPTGYIYRFTGEYDYLSNAWRLPPNKRIVYEGVTYPTVDHAFHALKTLDDRQREFLASVSTPNVARILAKTSDRRPDWKEIRLPLMRQLMWLKFQANGNELVPKLLDTKDIPIIFENTYNDLFWGAIWSEYDNTWSGENMVGKALMSIRAFLQNPCKALNWEALTLEKCI